MTAEPVASAAVGRPGTRWAPRFPWALLLLSAFPLLDIEPYRY